MTIIHCVITSKTKQSIILICQNIQPRDFLVWICALRVSATHAYYDSVA